MPNIIHCKDCKYNIRNPKYFYDKEKTLTFIWCQYFSDDDFCSMGKAMNDVEFIEEKEQPMPDEIKEKTKKFIGDLET